jgi:hypothetical protein
MYGNITKHKAALLLDTESGSRYTISEPGLPGRSRKGAYEGPTTRNVVGPFYFPSTLAVLRDMGIISRVGGEGKEYGDALGWDGSFGRCEASDDTNTMVPTPGYILIQGLAYLSHLVSS